MKALVVAFVAIAVAAVVAFFAYSFDRWLGLVAYTYGYAGFSIAVGILVGAIASGGVGHHGIWAGLLSFAIVASLLFLPAPSERILRSVLIRVPPGTPVAEIKPALTAAYAGSGYAVPAVEREAGRVWISLLQQEPGNCTAIGFETRDGVVVSGHFTAD